MLVTTCAGGTSRVHPSSLGGEPSIVRAARCFHTAPHLPNGILHALNRSAHQRLADPLSGVAMAAAAERIWMFLGQIALLGALGQKRTAVRAPAFLSSQTRACTEFSHCARGHSALA